MRIALASILLGATLAGAGEDPTSRYGALLGKYVVEEGVRYRAWREDAGDLATLRAIVAELAATNPATLSPKDRYALYLNLYNAKTLELVLTGNPERSIRDLSRTFSFKGPYEIFFRDILEFDGKRISLDDLEDRLREESRDPRVHFALNCASRSCPPLASEPYRGESLDRRLDVQTRAFLASPGSVTVEPGGKVRVSKIFDWFDGDFGGNEGVRRFLREYGPEEAGQALARGGRVAYHDYDWSLNEAR